MLPACLLLETRPASQVMFCLFHFLLLYLLFHFKFLASPVFSDPHFQPLCVSHPSLTVCTTLVSFTFVQLSVPPLCTYATFMRWSHFLSSEVDQCVSANYCHFQQARRERVDTIVLENVTSKILCVIHERLKNQEKQASCVNQRSFANASRVRT